MKKVYKIGGMRVELDSKSLAGVLEVIHSLCNLQRDVLADLEKQGIHVGCMAAKGDKAYKRLEDIPGWHHHKFEISDYVNGDLISDKPPKLGVIGLEFKCTCGEKAFSCKCGYVPDEPFEVPYDEPKKPHGTAGLKYLCTVCGEEISRQVFEKH